MDPLVAARLLHDLALCACFGAALFPLYAVREDAASLAGSLVASARAGRWAAWIALVSAVLWLVTAVASMADDSHAMFDPAAIWAVVSGMDFGRIWAVRLAGLVLLAMAASMTPRREAVVAGLAGVLLASIALTGHGPSGESWRGPIHALADALHLLAAGAWIGALIPLGLITRRREQDTAAVARVLQRFSGAGLTAVAILILTGLINAWVLVGDLPRLVGTPYGRLLTLKLVLFLAMLALAAINRVRLTPAIAAGPDPLGARARLYRHIVAEQALAVGVLAVVAFLGLMEPASAAG